MEIIVGFNVEEEGITVASGVDTLTVNRRIEDIRDFKALEVTIQKNRMIRGKVTITSVNHV